MLGVLIMNTGTPDSPTIEAIKPYLRRFLLDRNLIDMPPALWRPVVELCILPHRPKRTLPIYRSFWTSGGSPFMIESHLQRDKLEALLRESSDEPVAVELGMRYGNPSTQEAIDRLLGLGADRLVALPLYPQRTRACAGTCLEEFWRAYRRTCPAAGPPVTVIDHYWNEPGYLDALADSVKDVWSPRPGGKLVVSFHSIPLVHLRRGDTYPTTAEATRVGLAAKLGMRDEDVVLAYQSRFDSRKWQGPFLEQELSVLAAQGARDVAVVCPVFSVDCIETIHDVVELGGAAYLRAAQAAGIEDARFTYVPALGASDAIMGVLADCVLRAVA